ncbi:MAG: hypothetical protein L3J67_03145, partial [Hyphomicrobiaceae bacterium]|nr:hypothetical protein [Hyphomicrobiaceae bacterium]
MIKKIASIALATCFFIPQNYATVATGDSAAAAGDTFSFKIGHAKFTRTEAEFSRPHELMLKILKTQNINFADVLICPHRPQDNCCCRKPKTALLQNYLTEQKINRGDSYVIGDRDSDLQLAKN